MINRISNLRACVTAAVLGILAVVARDAAHAASLTYSDGDFSTNWSVTQVGPTGSVSAVRVASGGDPNAFWQVTNNVATTDIEAVSLRSDFDFDPALVGPITELSFSYDAVTYIDGQGQGTAPALLQDGVVYEVLPHDTGYYTSYQSLSFASLNADSFTSTDGSNTHPDFSASGSTITFGFLNSNTGTGIYSNRTTQSDYDNFSVTVDYMPVPEPGTCTLLGLATVGAGIVAFLQRRLGA